MMESRNCIVVLGFLTVISAVSGDVFQITSVAPLNRSGIVAEGGTFTLECSVNKYIRSCVWQHREPSVNDIRIFWGF